MKLKVYGLNNPENIAEIANLKPDFMGFIFYPKSSRYINNSISLETLSSISYETKKVGVFVNAAIDESATAYNKCKLDYVQLHGSEDTAFCARLFLKQIPVIKAFKVDAWFNFNQIDTFIPFCSFFLFDKTGDLPGGNGKKYSWDILKNYQYKLPFFLSGGISHDDVDRIAELDNEMLYAIDINSRFELTPGIKNVEKVRSFKNKLNTIINQNKEFAEK